MRNLIRFVVLVALSALVAKPAIAQSDAPENSAAVRSILFGLPEKDVSFAIVRFAENWDGPEAATLKLVSEVHPIVLSYHFEKLAETHGVKFKEVESIVWAGTRDTGMIGITTLSDQAAAERFAAAYVPEPTSKKVGAYELVTSAKSGNGASRFDGRRVVFGKSSELEKLLGNPRPKIHATAEPFLAAAAKASLLIVDVSPAAIGLGEDPRIAASPFAPLLKATHWRVSADIAEGLKITLRAEFADTDAAKAGSEVMPKVVQGLDFYFTACEQMMPEVFERDPKAYPRGREVLPYLNQAITEARKAIAKSTTKTTGNDVETKIEIVTARPMTTAVMLLTLGPRPAKEKDADK